MEKQKKDFETILDEASKIDLDLVEWPNLQINKEVKNVGPASDYSKKLYIKIYQLDLETQQLEKNYDIMLDPDELKDGSINKDNSTDFVEQNADIIEEKKNLGELISHLKDRRIELVSHWKENIRLSIPELKYKPEIWITADGEACYEKYAVVSVDSIIQLAFTTIERPDIVEDDILED